MEARIAEATLVVVLGGVHCPQLLGQQSHTHARVLCLLSSEEEVTNDKYMNGAEKPSMHIYTQATTRYIILHRTRGQKCRHSAKQLAV